MAQSEKLSRGFVHTLVDDVLSATDRLRGGDTEGHRREAIRTIFAAIEGIAWVYREHIRRAASDLDHITPLLDFALQEKAYIVTDRGDLVEQTRFISLTAMIRLTTQVAEKLNAGFSVDFSHVGWSNLKKAIATRNGLTHPKTEADLLISRKDLRTAQSAFSWLLALAIEGMAAANEAMSLYNEEYRSLIEDLRSGDPVALAEYRAALLEPET